MATFAGNYLREPDDFVSVTSEDQLLQSVVDDPSVLSSASTFAELKAISDAADDVAQPEIAGAFDRAVAVMNAVIADSEAMIDQYARYQGYQLPLFSTRGETVAASVPDKSVVGLAARLVWISLRQRRGVISGEQAELERDRIQRGELREIARGVLVLEVEHAPTASQARGRVVHTVYSSERRFSREKLEGL